MRLISRSIFVPRAMLLALSILSPLALRATETRRVDSLFSLILNPVPIPSLAQSMMERLLVQLTKEPFNDFESSEFFSRMQALLDEEKRDALIRIVVDTSDDLPHSVYPGLKEFLQQPQPRQKLRDLIIESERNAQHAKAEFLLKVLARSPALKIMDPLDEAWARLQVQSESPLKIDLLIALKVSRRFQKPLTLTELILIAQRIELTSDFYSREIQRELQMRLSGLARSPALMTDQPEASWTAILRMPPGPLRANTIRALRESYQVLTTSGLVEMILGSLEDPQSNFEISEIQDLLSKLSTADRKILRPFRHRVRQLLVRYSLFESDTRPIKDLKMKTTRLPLDLYLCREAMRGLFLKINIGIKNILVRNRPQP